MKLVIFGLGIAFSQAWGETNAPVALFARFEHPAATEVEATLRAELDTIMEPAGIQFVWRELPKTAGGEVHRELVVVTFKGACDSVRDAGAGSREGSALGWTHTSGGDLLPFVEVQCDRVLGLVKSEIRRTERDGRNGLFGRALGRVLAHELYHVLGRTRKHGARGVAKAMYSSGELTADRLTLDDADIERMWENRPEFTPEVPQTETGH